MRKLNIPKFNVSNLTVFVSLIVSICALATSLMQALIMKDQFKVMVEQQKLMSEQYKASVWARV
jgi:F0F1-type ATP synthase membrane subunit c/vacuolar-type H+-ATPase subunit K